MTYIENPDMSCAWAQAVDLAAGRGRGREIAPLTVCITGFKAGKPCETTQIRSALDGLLRSRRVGSVSTVASTIFPIALWNPSLDRARLYERYLRIYPWLRRKNRANSRGTYFGRMIAAEHATPNQLEFVLDAYLQRKVTRRSVLQVSVFDPSRDHVAARRLGFPCMQHVAFSPVGKAELSVTAFYATQYLIQRAYGNYVGLAHLGNFVAKALGRTLTKVTCMAGIAVIEQKVGGRSLPLTELKRIRERVRAGGDNR